MISFSSLWKGREVRLPDTDNTPQVRGLQSALEDSRRDHAEAMTLLREIKGSDLIESWRHNRPYLSWGRSRQEVDSVMKNSIWVFICVQVIGDAISSVPWVLERRTSKGWKREEKHHALDILEHPNEHMDWGTFIHLWTTYRLLSGEGYVLKNRAGFSEAQELWPVHPMRMTPVAGDQGILSRYDYRIGNQRKPQPIEDVISWINPDPANPLQGISPIRVAADLIAVDSEAANWQAASMRRMGVPSGVIKDPNSWNIKQFQDEKKKMENAHMGSEKARGTLYLDGGKEFVPLAMTPVELDLINSRAFNRNDILSLFGVYGPVVGVFDNATYNNVRNAYEMFWKRTITGHLRSITGALQHGWIRRDYGGDHRIRPDTSAIQILNLISEEMSKVVLNLRKSGIPMKEINRRLSLGFEEYDGWDRSALTTPEQKKSA